MSSRIYDDVKDEIIGILKNQLKTDIDLVWIFPRFSDLGDISFPLFNLSKELGKTPKEIGALVLETFTYSDLIDKLSLQEGFLNVFLKKNKVVSRVISNLVKNERYGSSNIKSEERIIVEHTSANPTGPLHVGNIRSSILGDVIGRLYSFLGAKINIRYYINDLGRQIAPLVIGYQLIKNDLKPDTKIDLWMGKIYAIMNTLLEINQVKNILASENFGIKTINSKYALEVDEVEKYKIQIQKTNVTENSKEKILIQLKKLLRIQSSLQKRLPQLYKILYNLTQEKIEDLSKETTHYVVKYQEGKDKKIVTQFRDLTKKVLSGHIETLKMLNIYIDDYDWESEYSWSGEVLAVLDELSKKGYLRHEKKARLLLCDKIANETLFKTKYNIKHEIPDLIIVNSEGITLYPCRDIVYHLHKLAKFNATYCYNVISKQQQLAQQGVKLALYALGKSELADKIEHFDYEYVTLVGRKMAGREFEYVTPDELYELTQREIYEILKDRNYAPEEVDEIAQKVSSSSIKYHILKMDPQKTITFDVKKAVDPNENSAPFLQYSYARALNILVKAAEKEIDVQKIITNALQDEMKIEEEVEWSMIKIIEELPYVLLKAVNTLKPDTVANYAYSLASAFHKFYDSCPVLAAKEKSLQQTRILIVHSTIKCLESLFEIMGIDTLEKM